MKNSNVPDQSPLNGANTYSPSVPISVYRELAAELQATQAMLDSINLQNQEIVAQNQQLVTENQQLRLEIDNIVKSALRIQQVASVWQSQNAPEENYSSSPTFSNYNSELSSPQAIDFNGDSNAASANPFVSRKSEKLFIEHSENRYRRNQKSKASTSFGNWQILLIVVLIITVAFGTGYLFIRPLLRR